MVVARVEEEMKYHGGMVVKHGQWSMVLEVECRMLCLLHLARRARQSNPIRGLGRGGGLASGVRVVVMVMMALDGCAAVESGVGCSVFENSNDGK